MEINVKLCSREVPIKMKIVDDHFEDLRKTLENSGIQKNYILIIDYLINFLGCLTLSALKNKVKEVSKDVNISDLMTGRWASHIEKWVLKYSTNRNLKSLLFIKEEFMQREDESRLRDYIWRWINLRSKLSHDTVLIDDGRLTEIIKRKLFQPKRSVDIFIDSILKIIKDNENILNADFFHFQNGTLYIYSGINVDSRIKYKHFIEESISVIKFDFPLSYKEVFLSLSPTQSNLLSGIDDIKIEMKTLRQKQYENDFELCINEREVKTIKKRFFNGNILIFPTSGFQYKDGDNNMIEVKALRNGKIQASEKRYIKIYSKVPEPRIYWEGTEEKKIPVDKVSDIKLSIQSVFEINNIEIHFIESSDHIEILNESTFIKTDTSTYTAIFNVQSTELGGANIKATLSFKDRNGEKKIKDVDIHLICTPNFFEPSFEGEKRNTIINEMLSRRTKYLIIGEGGIGKSRLIQEFINKNRTTQKIYDMTITAAMTLRTLLIKNIEITIDKEDKADEKDKKILGWFKEESISGIDRTFWIKDCHEIKKDKDMDLLKAIVDTCSKPESNIMLMLESRNETWSENARKVIEKIKETNT